MAGSHLTAERLRELLSYDPETGLFTWLVRRRSFAGSVMPGSIAGCDQGSGYIDIGIDRKRYYAHRLAWFYMTGTWPKIIDHIDRNRANNRWSNLREATNKENQENRTVRHDSSTGIRGVQPLPSGRWRASIKHNYKLMHIGCYATIEEAAAARKEAEGRLFTMPACEPQA